MSIRIVLTNDVMQAGCEELGATHGPATYGPAACGPAADAAWLLADGHEATLRRRELAQAGCAFGVECTSLGRFVEDRWGLFGTGSCISTLQRSLFMQRALREALARGSVHLSQSIGVVELLSQAAAVGLGLGAFVDAVESADVRGGGGAEPAELLASERDVLRVVGRYRDLLHVSGLCECSEALHAMAHDGGIAWPRIVVEGVTTLDAAWAAFFARIGQRCDISFLVQADKGSPYDPSSLLAAQLRAAGSAPTSERRKTGHPIERAQELRALSAQLFSPPQTDPVQATGAVRVLLPQGRYARTRLLAECIAESGVSEAVVACADPAATARALADVLVARGAGVQASFSQSFCMTIFGQLALNLGALADSAAVAPDAPFDGFVATDVAANPLMGLSPDAASALDAKWRADRAATAGQMLDDVEQASEGAAQAFVAAVRRRDMAAACDCADDMVQGAQRLLPADRSVCASAVRELRLFAAAAESAGEDPASALDALAQASVPCSCEWRPPGGEAAAALCVKVMSYGQAARLRPASVQLVCACDLSSDEQQVRIEHTPLDALLEKLGCAGVRDALVERRGAFAGVVRAASKVVVLERRLHDEECAPLSPAVVFEDAMDRYCTIGDESAVDEDTGLPAALLPYVRTRGEELLHANAGGHLADAPLEVLPISDPQGVCDAARERLMPVRQGIDALRDEPAFSPSALEALIECPGAWLAGNRLHVTGLDAGLGPAEKGTLVHAVMRRYYERWQAEKGCGKARVGQLPEAYGLLDAAFDEELAFQRSKSPEDGPIMPIDRSEELLMEDLRRSLHRFLAYDATLLEGFEPQLFEHRIGYDVRVEYAGYALVGCIDRVDFDEQGRAVIVDYKSSLGNHYCLLQDEKKRAAAQDAAPEGGLGFVLPQKVQTLIYAQALRRSMGVQVLGAVYVNTVGGVSQPRICGAYDGAVLGPETLPGVNADRSKAQAAGFPSFEALLDAVEGLVAERLKALAAGDLARSPRSERSCRYCPVRNCAERQSR